MTRGAATPYDILEVSPQASLEEIRLAYHRGALKYHPDNYHDNPVDAEEKFRTLAKAYKAALRAHLPAYRDTGTSEPCSPADFARMDTRWHSQRGGGSDPGTPRNVDEWSTRPNSSKSRSVPTVDENKVFVLIWAIATILGVIVVLFAGVYALLTSVHDEIEVSDILTSEIVALCIVAVIIAGAVYGIILTRKTIWLTLRLGVRLLPFLPSLRKRKQLPHDTSREP